MTDMLPLIICMQWRNCKLSVSLSILLVLPVLAKTVFSIDGWLFKQSDWRLSSVLDKTISLTDSFMQMHNTNLHLMI